MAISIELIDKKGLDKIITKIARKDLKTKKNYQSCVDAVAKKGDKAMIVHHELVGWGLQKDGTVRLEIYQAPKKVKGGTKLYPFAVGSINFPLKDVPLSGKKVTVKNLMCSRYRYNSRLLSNEAKFYDYFKEPMQS